MNQPQNHKYCLLLAIVLFCLPSISDGIDGDVTWLKTIRIPGNQIDKSSLQQRLGTSHWQDLFGGISALEYLGHDDLYMLLPDRGPLDGAVDWTCRIQIVQLSACPNSEQQNFRLVGTKLLKDGPREFSGLSTRYSECATKTKRLDPEGMRVTKDGGWFLADEYGPQLLEFSPSGMLVKHHLVPGHFRITNPGPDKKAENATNQSGRQGNRGMEGLAISTDGQKLIGLMQSPLLQDCERNSKGKPMGMSCRLIEFDIATGHSRELLYPLEDANNKLNEILAINEHEFLVIERDGKSGDGAKFKKIIKIDTSEATEIQDVAKLPAFNLPKGVTPVTKQVFIDLLDPRYALSGKSMPEKIEGITFGPDLDDGRKTLFIASDNDFKTDQPTLIYCFALGKAKPAVSGKLTTR